MRLNSITTKNFRTLQDLSLHFSRNYCTISGRNNAGKSCVIRLLSALFRSDSEYPWLDSQFTYKEDKTQWVKQSESIEVTYALGITKAEDPALLSFIEKIASKTIDKNEVTLSLHYSISEGDQISTAAFVDEDSVDDKAAKEIDKRIKDSNLFFLYNSAIPEREFYFGRGRPRMFFEFVMSADEKKAIDEAGKHIERSLRKLVKAHTRALSEILGRLTEKYDVQVSTPENSVTRRMPLGLNLKDRNVDVPIDDWGSGTQNRTHILRAILQANRIKTTASVDNKITPFVVIEEPESFLHPSAQAEFGRLLRHLSGELGIQIMVTTHSPHMLNQEEPVSNILLARQTKRGTQYETFRVDTSGEQWMAPFADHLGITPSEFSSLRPLFMADKSRVLLVEGTTDQEYFYCLQSETLPCDSLAADIEVVPYGGKDTLKNTLLLQFVLRKFDRVFVTYDRDADGEVRAALTRVGLKEGEDFMPLGTSQVGKDCIEGLLPQRVLASVNGRETDLVMRLGSRDNTERRKAKETLKKEYLREFKGLSDKTKDELKEFAKAIRHINSRLGGAGVRDAGA